MSNKLYAFLQLFFRLIFVYFLVFIWVRYYSQNIHFAIWMTALITFFVEMVIRMIGGKKQKQFSLKQTEMSQMDILVSTLTFMPFSYALSYLEKAFSTQHKVSKKRHYLLVGENQDHVVVPSFTVRAFCPDDLVGILSKTKGEKAKKLIVCTTKADKEALALAAVCPIKTVVLEKQALFTLVAKNYGVFPPEQDWVVLGGKKKSSFKKVLADMLSRRRSKGYFISSLVLALSCLIVPYNLYYLIFSSLLLLLALASLVAPLFVKVKNEPII